MIKLRNRVVLVTGAASGVGRKIVRNLLREGANVVIADLDPAAAEAEAAAAELGGAENRVIGVAMDVTNEAQVDAGMQIAVDRFGRLDVLLATAGIRMIAPPDRRVFGERERKLAIHFDGAFLPTRAALRQMCKQGSGGVIVHMGSTHSEDHESIAPANDVAREEARPGIAAAAVCPAFMLMSTADGQIAEQAKGLGILERRAVDMIILKETVDGASTTRDDAPEAVLVIAVLRSNAPTGQSRIVGRFFR
ncbi:MAG TPA: SDR family NAD(P)-dependent oxidoreductase [Stellaceae bacterium]|jgi:3-hydroxybutyrate dehydrogenase|nr:SDR family NAD(P)-dependent oxidoreductase [Stellaceae bacterium]